MRWEVGSKGKKIPPLGLLREVQTETMIELNKFTILFIK